MPTTLKFARVAAISVGALLLSGAKPPGDVLIRVYYDLEVAAYCGLVSSDVQQGFRVTADGIEKRVGASQEDIEQARMQAWKLAHLEWQNRGLGGFRGWCRNEGTEAANRFLDPDTN